LAEAAVRWNTQNRQNKRLEAHFPRKKTI